MKLLHSRWKELEAKEKLLAESENQKREIQKLKGELDTSGKIVEKLEEALDIRGKENEQLKGALDTREKESKQLKGEKEQLKGELDTSGKNVKKLEEELDIRGKENEQLKEKLDKCSYGNQNDIQYAKPKREDVPHTPQKMGFRHKLENNKARVRRRSLSVSVRQLIIIYTHIISNYIGMPWYLL